MDDPQGDLVAHVDAQQRVLQGLDRAGHVALDDQIEGVDLALGQDLVEVLQGHALAALGQQRLALGGLPLVGDLAGSAVVGRHQEGVARPGHGGQAEHGDRGGRASLGHVLARVVEHRAHAPVGGADHQGVADAQGTALHEHGGDRAAALVQVRLDGHAAGVGRRVRLQGQGRVRRQQHGLQQLVDALALLGGDVDEHDVAAVLLGDQAVLGELGADLVGIRPVLVDLVDRHDDRHVGRLRVVDGLDRLRHDAVIGRDHQDRDVGDLRAAGAHGGERLVAGGVDEGDGALAALVVDLHLVGPDVLGDAAELGVDDVGVADGVQQLRLAVVHVSHHGDDRRARGHVLQVLELLGL